MRPGPRTVMAAVLAATAMTVTGCSAVSPAGGPSAPPSMSPAVSPPATLGRGGAQKSDQLYEAQLAFDAKLGRIVAVGVRDEAGDPALVTWEWTGALWQRRSPQVSPPPRSSTVVAADGSGNVLLFGTSYTHPPIPAPPCVQTTSTTAAGQTQVHGCVGDTVWPSQLLSDGWKFDGDRWQQVTMQGAPLRPRFAAYDGSRHAVVVTGRDTDRGDSRPGTWQFDGHRWSLLSRTDLEYAEQMAYDPASQSLIAFAGTQPYTAPPGYLRPDIPGAATTWTFTPKGWVELARGSKPSFARGVLTLSPDGRHLLLVNVLGETWLYATDG